MNESHLKFSNMTRKRLFFALIPPNEFQLALGRIITSLQQTLSTCPIKWIPVGNLHVTLQFLAQFPDNKLPALMANSQAMLAGVKKFQISFGSVEWFPSEYKPTVLSLSLEPQFELQHIAKSLADVIMDLDYPLARPFRAHLSLGRLKEHKPLPSTLLANFQLPSLPAVTIDSVFLFESKTYQNGPQYTELAKYSLN